MGMSIENESVFKRIEEIRKFAERQENFYIVPDSKWIPGERKEFILQSGSFRVVFSITTPEKGKYFRHISISTIRNYPNPIIVFYICKLFGFTCESEKIPDPSWMVHINEEERAICVIQEYHVKMMALILRNSPVFREELIRNMQKLNPYSVD